MEKVSSRRWYDRITPAVILGALPFRSQTSELINEEGVRGVIAMNEDHELQHWVNNAQEWGEAGVIYLQLATADFLTAPTQDQIKQGIDFISNFECTGYSVYVHCKAGRTRSATLVACYLMQVNKWNPTQALNYIKEKRPHIIMREAHEAAAMQFYVDNVKS